MDRRHALALALAVLATRCTSSHPEGVGSEPAPPSDVEIAIGPVQAPPQAEPAAPDRRDPADPNRPARPAGPPVDPLPAVSRPDPAPRPRPTRVDVPAATLAQDLAVGEGRGETLLAEAAADVERFPGDPDRLYLLGRLQGLLRRGAAARDAFEQALAIDPEHAWSLHGLGILELREGRVGRAREALEKALAYEPENARFAIALASLEYDSAVAESDSPRRANRLERARGILTGLEAKGPIPPEVEVALALVLLELGRTSEAVDRAANAAAAAPEDPSIRCSQGRILEAAERFDEALAAYRAAMASTEEGPDAEFASVRAERLEQVLRASGADRIAAATRQAELAPFVTDPDPQTRRSAYKRLRELRQPGDVPTFLRGLADADRGVRIHSIWALGELGASEALPSILDVLHHDPDELARGAVGKALVDLAAKRAIGDLVDALSRESHPYVLDQIDFALRNLSGDDPLTGSAASRRRLFDTPEGRERLVAAWREWWSRRASSGR